MPGKPLSDHISAHTGDMPDPLPLFHVTDAHWLRETFADAYQLRPQPCSVFKLDLTYLFYGRCAYRPKHGDKVVGTHSKLPVCYVFKAEVSDNAIAMYPFDTGAFSLGMFRAHIDPRVPIRTFEIPPGRQTARRFVQTFYASNYDYVLERPSKGHSSVADPHVSEYIGLINTYSYDDDRRSAVEVQLDSVLQLDGDKLEALILPQRAMDIAPVQDFLEANPWT